MYLLLIVLKVSESAPETHDKHHAALMSIPTIVANRPVDINDLCVPITHQLIRLANDFNMEVSELFFEKVHYCLSKNFFFFLSTRVEFQRIKECCVT